MISNVDEMLDLDCLFHGCQALTVGSEPEFVLVIIIANHCPSKKSAQNVNLVVIITARKKADVETLETPK